MEAAFLINDKAHETLIQGEDRTLILKLKDKLTEEPVDLTATDDLTVELPHKVDGKVILRLFDPTFQSSQVNLEDDCIDFPEHGLADGELVELTTTGTLPTGLALSTEYQIKRLTKDKIQFINAAGVVVALTGAGSGTHTIDHFTAVEIIDEDDGIFEIVIPDHVSEALKSGPKWTLEVQKAKGTELLIYQLQKALSVLAQAY